VLRKAYGRPRVLLTDEQRRRLAVKGKVLGRRRLAEVAGIVTPDTILRWYRWLVAQKYGGLATRRPGRPRTNPDVGALVVRVATERDVDFYTHTRCVAPPGTRGRPQYQSDPVSVSNCQFSRRFSDSATLICWVTLRSRRRADDAQWRSLLLVTNCRRSGYRWV
jgi:hypothetical protein